MIGENIFIKTLERKDIETTTKWLKDPVMSDILGYLPTATLENQNEYFNKLTNDKSRFVFAICLREGGEHIGNVALGNVDYIHRHAIFSIFIYEKKLRGGGRGTEATKLCLQFAFDKLNLNKVYLRTSKKFVEAIKMYEKLGFIKEGVMRKHYYTNGVYEDKIIYSILKEEYNYEKICRSKYDRC